MDTAIANPDSMNGGETQRDIIGNVTNRVVNIASAQKTRLVQERGRLLDNYRVVTSAAKGGGKEY